MNFERLEAVSEILVGDVAITVFIKFFEKLVHFSLSCENLVFYLSKEIFDTLVVQV